MNILHRQWVVAKLRKSKGPTIQIVCVDCGNLLADLYLLKIKETEYECLNCGWKTRIGIRENL